jgi:hypothetical protein
VRKRDSVAAVLLVAATERELFAVDGAEQPCCAIGPVEAALAALGRAVPRVVAALRG